MGRKKLKILTREDKALRKASSLQKVLKRLLPSRVKVRPLPSLGGQLGCCVGHMCFTTKWRHGAVQPCCMHAPSAESFHECIRRRVGEHVLHVDPAASLFPEVKIRVCKRDARGRFAAGPTHSCDLLVVLRSGSVIVFEVDGTSHGRVEAQRRDALKDMWLRSRGVKCVRVGMMQCATHGGLCAEMQRVCNAIRDSNVS